MFLVSPAIRGRSSQTTGSKRSCSRQARLCGKIQKAPRGEDDFSTTPAGLDLAWTKRTRVTFACGLVNSGYEETVQSDVDLFINSLNIIPEKI